MGNRATLPPLPSSTASTSQFTQGDNNDREAHRRCLATIQLLPSLYSPMVHPDRSGFTGCYWDWSWEPAVEGKGGRPTPKPQKEHLFRSRRTQYPQPNRSTNALPQYKEHRNPLSNSANENQSQHEMEKHDQKENLLVPPVSIAMTPSSVRIEQVSCEAPTSPDEFVRTYYNEIFSYEASRLTVKNKKKIKVVVTSSDAENTRGHAAKNRSNPESKFTIEARSSVGSVSTVRIPPLIFVFVIPPEVSSITRDALVEWLKHCKEYEETMKERCKDEKEDIGTVMKSVKNSSDKFMPSSTAIRIKCPPALDVNNMDITSRMTNYFMASNTPIKKYGFTSFYEEENGPKKKRTLIVNSLPATLKEKVKNEFDYRFPEAQSNVMKLYELIGQQALEEAIEHRALSRERNLNRKQKPREQAHSIQKNQRQYPDQQQTAERFQKRWESCPATG
ncbi:unnamed protein product [Phytophthora fragariaefolia]|uniref:Unnamed protein product n=1 Tax=Phytophthora fragariaefolia TaxID=1490495 RepID=A0A9W7CZJ2_9STRA|nr:unnamed protein product [Phytophthora fragariaefolia]